MAPEAFEKLAVYIKNKINIRDDELARIRDYSILKKLRRKQYLLQAGDIWNLNAFVVSGCLRTYSLDDKGVEHVISFAIENWWAGDRHSLESGSPSMFNIDAIEDTDLIILKEEHFEQLRKEIPLFNDMINDIFYKGFIAAQSRIHAAIAYTAEERYLHFLKTYPDFSKSIPQSMIASYLGISPETLSRIRNRVFKSN